MAGFSDYPMPPLTYAPAVCEDCFTRPKLEGLEKCGPCQDAADYADFGPNDSMQPDRPPREDE